MGIADRSTFKGIDMPIKNLKRVIKHEKKQYLL
jgi:hypothetical protein